MFIMKLVSHSRCWRGRSTLLGMYSEIGFKSYLSSLDWVQRAVWRKS